MLRMKLLAVMLSTALSVVGLGGQYPNLPGTSGKDYSEAKMVGYLEATNNYTVGSTLLAAKDFEHAGYYYVNAFNNKEWANACFTVEESALTYEDGSCAGKVVDYFKTQGNTSYIVYSEYYGEDLSDVAYCECFVIMPCGDNWVTSACYAPDGVYIPYAYDDVEDPDNDETEVDEPEAEEPEVEENDDYALVREQFLHGKQLAAEGKYEEAGLAILGSITIDEWVNQYFQIEESYDEMIEDGMNAKKVVRYWAEEQDGYAAAVLKYYVNDPEVMDYFVVRSFENGNIDNVVWVQYAPNGTFMRVR